MEYKNLHPSFSDVQLGGWSLFRGKPWMVTLPRDVTALGYSSHPALLDIILLVLCLSHQTIILVRKWTVCIWTFVFSE